MFELIFLASIISWHPQLELVWTELLHVLRLFLQNNYNRRHVVTANPTCSLRVSSEAMIHQLASDFKRLESHLQATCNKSHCLLQKYATSVHGQVRYDTGTRVQGPDAKI
jgi:hypothetical protein